MTEVRGSSALRASPEQPSHLFFFFISQHRKNGRERMKGLLAVSWRVNKAFWQVGHLDKSWGLAVLVCGS